jgi:N utilization substance protein A
LFELEVPEIFEKIIEIRAIAREPGDRTKLAVYSADERIDPVGACVGIKGVRVQSIVRELNNERIDIVAHSSNYEVFVTRPLAPAKVVTTEVYESTQSMTVAVEDDKLSLAIGKNGQNARLASRLTGWKINIMSETDYNDMKRREAEMMVPIGKLSGIGDVLEERLVEEDINTVQDLADMEIEELVKIEGIGDKTGERLIERAREYMAEFEEKRRLEEEALAEQMALEKAEQEEGMFVDDESEEEEPSDSDDVKEEPIKNNEEEQPE